MKKVAVVMGSDSDLKIVEKGFEIFDKFGIGYEVRVLSAHRTPEEAAAFAKNAEESDIGVIIAAAGMAAHLAGAIAANTTLPVIGLPINSTLMGLDALLATVQMPPGIPVATVGIDAGKNAALLAAQILAVSDMSLAEKLKEERNENKQKIYQKDALINSTYKK